MYQALFARERKKIDDLPLHLYLPEGAANQRKENCDC